MMQVRTAGLGLPSGVSPQEPVGHMGMGPEFRATTGGVPNLSPIWPAGNAHSDIEDLARYAAFHLAGLRGADGVLKAETVAALHQPAPGRRRRVDLRGTRWGGRWSSGRGRA